MADETVLHDETVARMVAAIEPDGTLDETARIDQGGNEVYRVTVNLPAGARERVLKVSLGGGGDLSGEARLLRLLETETDVPVPSVVGVVDDHPDLPAPFFLMERLDGEQPPADPAEIPIGNLTSYATDVGRYLGAIHGLDAFDGYGPIVAARDVDPVEAGGTRPLAREYGLTIPDSHASWEPRLAATAESMLDRLRETRFGDLAPAIADAVAARRTRLDLPGPPVIARLDHHPANLVVDSGSRAVTGLLDWGICRTTPAEYELVCAEQGFCGVASLDADRRERVRVALADGYGETDDVPGGGFEDRRRLYLLVNVTGNMNWASGWITPSIADEVERDYRAFVDELL